MAGASGDDELVGVSLVCMLISQVLGGSVNILASFSRCGVSPVGAICITTLTVQVGMLLACTLVSQVLGVSVDIPMSFSRCGSLSSHVVCETASTEVVVVCVLESTWLAISLFLDFSVSAHHLPQTLPSFLPQMQCFVFFPHPLSSMSQR